MAEIKCPKCGEIIKLDKSDYDALLNEVRDEEFERALHQREKEINERLEANFKLQENNIKNSQNELISKLKADIDVLNQKLDNSKNITELEVNKAINKYKDELNDKENKIRDLNNKLDNSKKDFDLEKQKLIDKYTEQIDTINVDLEKWKNYRMGDSTKDLGESLEQYCHESFEEIRADAYPNAYFEKDNDSSDGSKGDFIFRDFKEDIEYVSIMFEMKNQKDDTEHKHKNEDFLKKLDSDRNKKNCEYAVLVTTLESDSKLYNKGIVDVSHRYPKMFVIRPQFFLAIIGLIRNMALKTFDYKKQVAIYQRENLDITNFEDAVKMISDKISNDYERASNIYNSVDDMCNDIIKKVEKFRSDFKTATGWIEKAKNQLPNLEVRKLTKNNPTMKEKFEELKNK